MHQGLTAHFLIVCAAACLRGQGIGLGVAMPWHPAPLQRVESFQHCVQRLQQRQQAHCGPHQRPATRRLRQLLHQPLAVGIDTQVIRALLQRQLQTHEQGSRLCFVVAAGVWQHVRAVVAGGIRPRQYSSGSHAPRVGLGRTIDMQNPEIRRWVDVQHRATLHRCTLYAACNNAALLWAWLWFATTGHIPHCWAVIRNTRSACSDKLAATSEAGGGAFTMAMGMAISPSGFSAADAGVPNAC